MCLSPVTHYIFSYASIAEWLALQMDSHIVCVRVSWAAKRFRQMHGKINILYTVLVQNIENGKLHRQVDSVDAGLNWESKSHVFFSLRSLYCIYESFQGKIIHAENDWIYIIVIKFTIIGADIAEGRHAQLTANNCRRLIGVYSWPAAGDIYAHTTPNWVKVLPIYERDIGEAAASPISRPSSPVWVMNAYKSLAPLL